MNINFFFFFIFSSPNSIHVLKSVKRHLCLRWTLRFIENNSSEFNCNCPSAFVCVSCVPSTRIFIVSRVFFYFLLLLLLPFQIGISYKAFPPTKKRTAWAECACIGYRKRKIVCLTPQNTVSNVNAWKIHVTKKKLGWSIDVVISTRTSVCIVYCKRNNGRNKIWRRDTFLLDTSCKLTYSMKENGKRKKEKWTGNSYRSDSI